MNVNDMIINCIKEYCDKQNELYENCNNKCALCDENGICEYYQVMYYIKELKGV